MTDLQASEDLLYKRASEIIETARGQVARAVNTAMVHAYWLIGREIVEKEQGGKTRANYGDQLTKMLAKRLSQRFGRGFSHPNIKRMRQFYLAFPTGSALVEHGSRQIGSTPSSQSPLFPPTISWSHYCLLMRRERDVERQFYEIETARDVLVQRKSESEGGGD